MRVLVTGGAGFIGSHLVESLLTDGHDVIVIDDLSTGKKENLVQCLGNPRVQLVEGDLLSSVTVESVLRDREIVFHLAGNAGVEIGSSDTRIDFERNVIATYNVLEAMRKSKRCKKMVFASTSTVYGEPTLIPTPEDYGPLVPISLYGSTKLAAEALILGYSEMFGLKSAVLRLANVVGSRSCHGVVYDFIRKLLLDPTKLEILGDGTQSKSYLFVDDCIEALLLVSRKLGLGVEFYNVGSGDRVDVKRIAEIVIDEMGLRGVELAFVLGGAEGRGWKGDVKWMQLDSSKLNSIGWNPRYDSVETVKLSTRAILEELGVKVASQ